MNKIILGLTCGLAFGIIDVLIMIPLNLGDNRKRIEAMSSAFLERFMIGFLIPVVDLGISSVITGLLLGLGLSVPTAIITRAYAPIIGFGVGGGLVIGYIVSMLA